MVPVAKRVGADLLELVALKLQTLLMVKRNSRSQQKKVARQTVGQQLGSGGRKRTVRRVIPTKTAKQTNRSRTDIFTNIFGTNLFWQFLESLQGGPSS